MLLGFFTASPELMRIGTVELRIISLSIPLRVLDYARRSIPGTQLRRVQHVRIHCETAKMLLPAAYFLSKLGNVDYTCGFSFVFAEFFGLSMSIIYTKKRLKKDIINDCRCICICQMTILSVTYISIRLRSAVAAR